MSKLYLSGRTDARRSPLTARAHKQATMNFLFNWRGGNTPEGAVQCSIEHHGKQVNFYAQIGGTKEGWFVKFFPDGTYQIEKMVFYPKPLSG